MITISLAEIRAESPCADGWRTVLAAKGPDMDALFPLTDIIETNDFDDALWAMRCRPEHNNLWRKYAVWCARQVEHLMTDDRSVAALDVAWRHSDGLATDEELAAAWATAWDAAWDAAGDAASGTARSAARATAWDAAWDAAWGASSAAGGATGWPPGRDAASAAQKQKLIEILNAGEWV